MGRVEKHLTKLAAELQPGEEIEAYIMAIITDTPTSTSGATRGTLVLTDRRLLFSGTGVFSSTSRSMPLTKITSVDLHKNLLLAYIQVTAAGGGERFLIKYNDAEPFVRIAHDRVAQAHERDSSSVVQSMPVASAADELAKMAQLRAQGILTDDEFAAAKARILGA